MAELYDPEHALMAQEFLKEKRPEQYKKMGLARAIDPETGKETSELVAYVKNQAIKLNQALKREMKKLEERGHVTGMDELEVREFQMAYHLDPDKM